MTEDQPAPQAKRSAEPPGPRPLPPLPGAGSGHPVVKLAGREEIALYLVGVSLLAVEAFVPGHIAPAIAGAACALGALVLGLVDLKRMPLDVVWHACYEGARARGGALSMSVALLVVLLMIVGIVLLAIEVFVIPGFGLIGLLGCASILGAAVVAWVALEPVYGLAAVAFGVGAAGLLFWLFPRTGAGRAMVLSETQQSGRGPGRQLAALAGKEGRALTPLRPAGTVEIDDRTIDVVTDGRYVNAGDRVRVAKVEGTRVVVEPSKG